MELRPSTNEAVNIAGNILVIVELAWDVGIKAKSITSIEGKWNGNNPSVCHEM